MTVVAISSAARSRFGVSLPLLLGLLVYSTVIRAGGMLINDGDPYWHIAIGRWIIAHRAVPTRDIFSFSMSGAPWEPPEWLSEIAMAWLYDNFSWAGLVAASGLSMAIAVMLVMRALLHSLPPVIATIGGVLCWCISLSLLAARPPIFALPILVAWTVGLVAARNQDRAPSPVLALLMVFWANLHPSYIIGLGLMALLAGEAILLAPDWPSRVRAARGWGLFGVLSIAAAVITPFGIDGLALPFKLTDMSFTSTIVPEWKSPNFQGLNPLELWLMLLLFAGLSLGWRLPPIRVGIVLLLLHMALIHARHVLLVGFVGPLLLAPALAPQLRVRSGDHPAAPIDRVMAELAKPANAIGIAVVGALVLAVSAAGLRGGAISPIIAMPERALATVATHNIEGPVLNDYTFGGYLMFRGVKAFIDGRYLPYGDAFMRRFYEATQVPEGQLPGLLSEYGITWTLLPPTYPAVVLLDHLPGWRRLYADDIAVVHVRDNQEAR
jgi:hypothetical protein